MTAKEFYLKTRAANSQIPEIKKTALLNSSEKLVEINTRQLSEGTNALGRKITPKYKYPRYAMMKYRMNSKAGYGTPDLFLSGRFWSTFKLYISGTKFYTKGNTPYAKYLEAAYNSIYGFSKKGLETAKEIVTREFISIWKKKAE